jgi:hypothetical protein
MVWSQYRKVEAGSVTVEDLDMEITIENKDSLTFDISIYNLADETWASIAEGDRARVTLGWANGDQQSVINGVIEKKTKQMDNRDIVFRLKGEDESDLMVKHRFSRSWKPVKTPVQIAGDIAKDCGLTTGELGDMSETLEKDFTVIQDKPARYWLDELKAEAEDLTEYAWEWFVDAGNLHFVKKDGRTEEAISLSYDTTLISIGPADAPDTEDGDGLQFEAMLEPNLRKGGSVVVETEKHQGPYKVTEYTFVSSTVSGDHVVRGKLSPLDVEYTIGVDEYDTGEGLT